MLAVIAQLEFAAPGRLVVLVLLPALALVALRGRRGQSLRRRMIGAALRMAVVVLLCAAWAAPSWRAASQRKFVVFAIDESASSAASVEAAKEFLGAAEAELTENETRWIAFAEKPESIDSENPLAKQTRQTEDPSATNIAAVLDLAQAVCPADRVPHVLLLSDGLENRGSALASAAAAGMPLSVVPLEASRDDETAIESIDVLPGSSSHQPARIIVAVGSNHDDSVTLKLLQDGTPLTQTTMKVSPGVNLWTTEATLTPGETTRFDARIEGGKDRFGENNQLAAIAVAPPPARVLVVANETGQANAIAKALGAGKFDARAAAASELPAAVADLRAYSAIILDDVAANSLGASRLAALDAFVREGGGLIVAGGESTFGAAAYELTALEKMLPVVAAEQPPEQQKSLALVLIVDKSKSMEQENRLGLAKEAAKKVADVLHQRDQVGVLAFGDDSQWISRLAPLSNKEEVLARIDKLEASGLTNMYPALERAYLSLWQADADSRHAILLTDGVPTPGDFDEVARRMAAAGITVSTVSLGQGADQTILQEISRIARGNHHHVDNPGDLPSILERETRSAASKVTDNVYPVQTARQLPGLDVGKAPPLSGYVATSYKPGAQLLLTAGEGDPLLAWWRYGRGEAMVLTTDFGDTAQAWRDWPGYAKFWQRLATHAMRRPAAKSGNVEITQRNGRVMVTLDAFAQTEGQTRWLTDAKATASVTSFGSGGDLSMELFEMPQVAPGRYEASFTAPPGAQRWIDVGLTDGEIRHFHERRGVVLAYPEEFRLRATDTKKLQTIAAATGGKYDPAPSELFEPDGRTVDVLHPLWSYFLMLAIVVYVADIAVARTSNSVRET